MEIISNVFIVFVAFLSVVLAQEETECRGELVALTEKENATIKECYKQSNITTENLFKIPLEKLSCFGVCILKEKDMLTKDGKINHEKALKYVETHMKNKKTQKLLIDATDKCIKEHGDMVKVENDPHCITFMEVGSCVHDAFLEICLPDPM